MSNWRTCEHTMAVVNKHEKIECMHCKSILVDGQWLWFAPPSNSRPRDIDDASAEKDSAEAVNHPPHYTSHPSGIEAIEVCEHFPFSIGNVIKYLWRAGLKNDAIEDLKKARWYLSREIEKREKENNVNINEQTR